MILIADSGSTKTDWRVIDDKGTPAKSLLSEGINPYFLNEDEIYQLLRKELKNIRGCSLSRVFFYGTGCNGAARIDSVRRALKRFFKVKELTVASDLLGAARSLCHDQPGIACILGTGSNSCYYDGKEIISNIAPLGYILGDEGGAAVIGRKLLSAILKKQISARVIDLFFDTYKITQGEILESVYMKPFPNRFLGQYTNFIHDNIIIPELREIITTSFDDFVKRNILQYPESAALAIHFTGSIAFHFSDYLEETLRKNNLQQGRISMSPMDDLIKYHLKYQENG